MKRQILVVFFVLFAGTHFLHAMHPSKSSSEPSPEPEEKRFFIQFFGEIFPVSEETLEQFETYKVEKESKMLIQIKGREEGGVAIIEWTVDGFLSAWYEEFLKKESIFTLLPKKLKKEKHKKEKKEDIPKKAKKIIKERFRLLLMVAEDRTSLFAIKNEEVLFQLFTMADLMQNNFLSGLFSFFLMQRLFDLRSYLDFRYASKERFEVGNVVDLSFYPNRKTALMVTKEEKKKEKEKKQEVRLCSLGKTYETLEQASLEGRKQIHAVIPHPTKDLFFLCGDDGLLELWDAKKMEFVRSFEGHKGRVVGVVIGPKREKFFSYDDRGNIFMWAFSSEKPVYSVKVFRDGVNRVLLHPNEKELICCGNNRIVGQEKKMGQGQKPKYKRNILVLDVKTMKLISKFNVSGYADAILDIHLDPTGKFLTTLEKGGFRIFDYAKKVLVRGGDFPLRDCVSMAVDPSGKLVAVFRVSTGRSSRVYASVFNVSEDKLEIIKPFPQLKNYSGCCFNSIGTWMVFYGLPGLTVFDAPMHGCFLDCQELSLDQVLFCLNQKRNPKKIETGSEEAKMFMTLPQFLQKALGKYIPD